ncbi:MAG TPA: hypothetical protein VG742_10755 [Dongiaceae bacterium]|nr:hypothetical protein [Dongiaceae bacterium]
MDKYQLAAVLMTMLGLGAMSAMPSFATDDIHPSLLGALMGDRAKPLQVADTVQSTSSSSSASASSSSSVTITGGKKQGKCTAEATANAKAGDVEDSDHDLKVVEGDGCSAKAESRAVVKPQRQQTE